MNSLYQFIIKPIGERYKNKINIEGQELIVNSTISSHKFVNREAECFIKESCIIYRKHVFLHRKPVFLHRRAKF